MLSLIHGVCGWLRVERRDAQSPSSSETSPSLPQRKGWGRRKVRPQDVPIQQAHRPLRPPPLSLPAAQRKRKKGQRMERGCDEGSFLKTQGLYRMGVGGTQAHIPALCTRGSRAAERAMPSSPPPHPPLPQSRVLVGLSGVTREICSLPPWVQKSP